MTEKTLRQEVLDSVAEKWSKGECKTWDKLKHWIQKQTGDWKANGFIVIAVVETADIALSKAREHFEAEVKEAIKEIESVTYEQVGRFGSASGGMMQELAVEIIERRLLHGKGKE